MRQILCALLAISGTVFAAMDNHYVLGTHGLNSAVKPDEGFVYTAVFTHYHGHSLKDSHGKSVHLVSDRHHLNINTLQNFFSFYSPLCFFGGKYGFQVNVPLTSAAMDVIGIAQSFDVQDTLRLSDIYVEPINLRYSWQWFDLFLAYGFYIPTGKCRAFDLHSTGYGSWGNMFTLAGTVFFDYCKTWSFSAYTTYEIHGQKRHFDFTPGSNLCIDWGLGKTFGQYYSLGIVGYYEQQLSAVRGNDAIFFEGKGEDRVWAVGGEFGVFVPQIDFELTLRYEQEFGAHLRTEGSTFVAVASIEF